MPRPKRVHVPNGIWHVTQLATDSEVFFRDPDDFRAFLELVGLVAAWARWRLHDYCLMTNHVHLVVQTPLPTLPPGMRRLMGTYVEEYNAKYERRGALVHGRYGAKLVDSDEYYAGCLVYVANNPVTAGLCERPEEWPWSGSARRADRLSRTCGVLAPTRPFGTVSGRRRSRRRSRRRRRSAPPSAGRRRRASRPGRS